MSGVEQEKGVEAAPGQQDVTAEEMLRSLEAWGAEDANASEESYRRKFTQDSIQQEYAYAHLAGIQDHYKHKGRWSWFLMSIIGLMMIFQLVLITLVGVKLLDFTDYEWLVQLLLVQNLAQVVGLAIYAVKYLFSDISHQKITPT